MAVLSVTTVDRWIAVTGVFIAAALLLVAINLVQGQILFAAGNVLVAAILAAGLYFRWTTPPERRSP